MAQTFSELETIPANPSVLLLSTMRQDLCFFPPFHSVRQDLCEREDCSGSYHAQKV